jgi:hypothetical protein
MGKESPFTDVHFSQKPGRFPLDFLDPSKVLLALGVQTLGASHTKPTLRLRRSDGVERDVYPWEIGEGGPLNEWLAGPCGGLVPAYVSRIYDVSGNANHAVQGSAGSQPLFSGGSVVLSSSPTILNMVGSSVPPVLGVGDFWMFSQIKKGTWTSGNCYFFEYQRAGNNRMIVFLTNGYMWVRFTDSAGANVPFAVPFEAPTAGSTINMFVNLDRDGLATVGYRDSSGKSKSNSVSIASASGINLGSGNSNTFSVGVNVSDATFNFNYALTGTGLLTQTQIERLLSTPFPES